MILPQYKKKKRIKLKVCHFVGCGREFWGHPIAKYCPNHSNIKERLKAKKNHKLEHPEEYKEKKPIDINNLEYKHENKEVVEMEFPCHLEGCNKSYHIKIFPKQFIYPKYCEDHRNPFKREMFLKIFGKQ